MIVFHLHILSTFPLAVPLEWNVFMIFGILFLFGHYGDVPWSTLDDPLLIAILAVTCVGIPILGNFRPDLISFLPSMRYYAGNWATSQWLFEQGERRREEARPQDQEGGADRRRAAARALRRRPGRGADLQRPRLPLDALARPGAQRPAAARGRRRRRLRRARRARSSPASCSATTSATGTSTTRALLEAVQERCRFEPGELRVVMLESQPAHEQTQRYRIYDAADGLVEEGWVEVADMVERQPWLGGEPFPQSRDRHERGGDRRRRPQRAGLRGDAGDPRRRR